MDRSPATATGTEKEAAISVCSSSALAVLFLSCPPLFASDLPVPPSPVDPEAFGKVSFPVSCNPEVQRSFDQALALLHSFWYEEAEKQFRKVAESDPKCGMAFWGIAMSHHHALWGSTDDKWLTKGREAAKDARTVGAKTERERRFISAIDSFYATEDLRDFNKRVSAFSVAMRPPFDNDPKDVEAASLYALSILGLAPVKDDSLAYRKRAVALLESVLKEAPDHPGATHYLIHACDVPALARFGLPAARRYARLAPLAPHALHMPSHIFIRLGRWPDVIDSNLASVNATRQAIALGMKGDASHQLHAMSFLQYAYLQTGREQDSLQLMKDLDSLRGLYHDRIEDARSTFPARHALELHDWSAASKLPVFDHAKPWSRRITHWARAIGASRQVNVQSAREDFKQFTELEEGAKVGYPWKRMQVERKEVEAWIAFAEGKKDAALATFREAAAIEGEMESEQLSSPAAEMLGDALLLLNRPAEALTQYEAALILTPGRFDALYGAARSAKLAGDKQKSHRYFSQLLANCAGSSSGRPELREAKAAVR